VVNLRPCAQNQQVKPASFSRLSRTLVRTIRERRTLLGMTQEEIAHSIGVTARHYQKIEAGRVNVTLRTLCGIADALKIAPGELLAP